MGYRYLEKQPSSWEGKHVLKCSHCFNSRSKYLYLMYCDILKDMGGGRVKIKVYGERLRTIDGGRIRYVEEKRVASAEEFGIEKVANGEE